MSSERAPRALGVAALALAGLALLLEVIAIAVGAAGGWALATALAWGVIALTVPALAGGIAAVLTRRGRAWGVGAIVLAVAANPLVQIGLLRAFGGQ